jgi:hypothetical protein
MNEDPHQYRPRCNKEQNDVVMAMKSGWSPNLSELSEYKVDVTKDTPAKVLIFDVETAPLQAYTWGIWQQDIGTNMLQTDWFMLTWSAKWLFDDNVMSDGLTPEEALIQDDRRVTESIWKLLDEADIIIAHNAVRFDVKKLNTRFFLNGMNPPMPYQVIDTLLHLRNKFSISSNKLDYACEVLGLDGKMATGGFALWDGCMKGDKESLVKMEEYNRKDVLILEDLYLRMRSWIKPHPNMGLFIEDDVAVCPSCASENITFGGTPYRTAASAFDSFRCDDCGSVGRSKKNGHKLSTTRATPK